VRGLLYAGALVTLWDVNDQSTAEVMRLFYQAVGSQRNKAGALRQATWEVRKQYPILFIGPRSF
jgi:CHAT domain-containing protein